MFLILGILTHTRYWSVSESSNEVDPLQRNDIRAPGLFKLVRDSCSRRRPRSLNVRFLPVISMGRCNTLNKTLEDGVHADELKESSRFYGGIEGGVEGPLEASRSAKVAWASIWRTLNRLFITCRPRRAGSRPQQRGVTQVLRRPVESAAISGRRIDRKET